MQSHHVELEKIVSFYQNLRPEGLDEIGNLYTEDASFKDPFNQVIGANAIQSIFAAMFVQLDEPRFVVRQAIQSGESQNGVFGRDVFLVWDFTFFMKRFRRGEAQRIHGSSHLRLDRNGRIEYHRDYWDAAEELYEKLPVLGTLMRFLKRQAQH
jgi:steroid Delta-isomerase